MFNFNIIFNNLWIWDNVPEIKSHFLLLCVTSEKALFTFNVEVQTWTQRPTSFSLLCLISPQNRPAAFVTIVPHQLTNKTFQHRTVRILCVRLRISGCIHNAVEVLYLKQSLPQNLFLVAFKWEYSILAKEMDANRETYRAEIILFFLTDVLIPDNKSVY